MIATNSALLTKEDFTSGTDLPEWLLAEYRNFHKTVTDKTFPCYFGMSGELKGELRYAYITQDDWSNLPAAVESFLALFNDPKHKRHGLFVFVEPFKEEGSLEAYRQQFWDILQYLHDEDEMEWPKEAPRDPDHYLWDFTFQESRFSSSAIPQLTSSGKHATLAIRWCWVSSLAAFLKD